MKCQPFQFTLRLSVRFSIRIWTGFFAWTTLHSRNMFGQIKNKRNYFFLHGSLVHLLLEFVPIAIVHLVASLLLWIHSSCISRIFGFCIFFFSRSFLLFIHSIPCISQWSKKNTTDHLLYCSLHCFSVTLPCNGHFHVWSFSIADFLVNSSGRTTTFYILFLFSHRPSFILLKNVQWNHNWNDYISFTKYNIQFK